MKSSGLIKKAVVVPNGVEVLFSEDFVTVQGPMGELKESLLDGVLVEQKENEIWISPDEEAAIRQSDHKKLRMRCGTFWALLRNMVLGVTVGYSKELEIVGVGYRAQLQGKKLVINLGYSHPVEVEPPAGITFEVPGPNAIVVKGIAKQAVGQIAAEIRAWREPIVYSGKGIRYKGE